MRHPGEWMTPIDERLLECVKDQGNMTPIAISKGGEVPRVDVTEQHAGKRMRVLACYGLLTRLDRGLYGITSVGEGYLDGEVYGDKLDRRPFEETFIEIEC